VGGCVRDWLLGRAPKDFDVEVYGLSWEELARTLRPFGPTDIVGRSFGVIKVRVEGSEYDIALPRRETKTHAGHRGFAVEPDGGLDERAACARRDFTINAILYDPLGARLVDPFGGEADLRQKVLRHTSEAFAEDPLRVLRGVQFAARFGLSLAPETAALCASIADSFAELARERVWAEWDKFATLAEQPSRGLAALRTSGWLRHFPELAALDGTPQDPLWHPEGDVFTHTGHCIDALVKLPTWKAASEARRRLLFFAVLGHDFGKPATTHRAIKHGAERWVSPGHPEAGGQLVEVFLQRLGAPLDLPPCVRKLVENHHAHTHFQPEGPSPTLVRRLARRLEPATIEDLLAVMEADHLGRPPLVSENTALRIEQLRAAALAMDLQAQAPRPILLGRDLLALGLQPGRHFKPLLEAAFEAQLDGAFADHIGGTAWLRAHIGNHPKDTPS